jgi:monoamine oxidase
MPPVCLSHIQFTPKLSLKREMINQKAFMGSTIKMIVLYKTRFWKNKGYSGETLSDCMNSSVYNARDDSRVNEKGELQPALVIFTDAGISRHWIDKSVMTKRTLEKLAEYFGPEALDPVDVHIQNWSEDENIRGGAIINFAPGLLSQVGDITEPEKRIYWAGTEMAELSQGYMDGAIRAGKKAAVDVSKELTMA